MANQSLATILISFALPFTQSLIAEETEKVPVDYSEITDTCEYSETLIQRRTSITRAKSTASPKGLDSRREAIITALWENDEERFHELAKSPITGKRGLENQKFSLIARGWNRYRDEGLRTMRFQPIQPRNGDDSCPICCSHQWMSLPKNLNRKPYRGNLHMVFDPKDLSLRSVDIRSFKNRSISYLPKPTNLIPSDPVIDRAPSER